MRRCVVPLLVSALLVAAPLAAQQVENPDLFAKSLKAAEEALAQFGPYDDAATLTRIADIGYRVAAQSGYGKLPITFYLIDMPEPNAFALPGGQVFVTRGMVDIGLSDDMMAGLLGHEIAHVVREHGIRMERRATLLNVLSQALLVGVMIGAEHSRGRRDTGVYAPYDPRAPQDSGGDVIQGAYAAGVVVSELLLRSYSREFEDEADEEGQRWSAAAGFDPDGTRQLMAALRARIPESKEYGYWRTHPFFEERVQAAVARERLLTRQSPEDDSAYRRRTQDGLLDYLQANAADQKAAPLLQQAALTAWPQGPDADSLRLDKLHRLRDEEIAKSPLSIDYGRLLRAYRRQMGEVAKLTPESPLLHALRAEIQGFEQHQAALYPRAAEVFAGGVYQTDFLETFLSNYPDAKESPAVSLALGTAYGRLGREADAVACLLKAHQGDPGGLAGKQAEAGLRKLAPQLDQLGALQQLAQQQDDSELRDLAHRRLAELATSYDDLANGADYLKRFPEAEHAEAVTARLNTLADQLYGEIVLYQAVGDHVKAIQRIEKILTYAPLSPAADRLRDRAIVQS